MPRVPIIPVRWQPQCKVWWAWFWVEFVYTALPHQRLKRPALKLSVLMRCIWGIQALIQDLEFLVLWNESYTHILSQTINHFPSSTPNMHAHTHTQLQEDTAANKGLLFSFQLAGGLFIVMWSFVLCTIVFTSLWFFPVKFALTCLPWYVSSDG